MPTLFVTQWNDRIKACTLTLFCGIICGKSAMNICLFCKCLLHIFGEFIPVVLAAYYIIQLYNTCTLSCIDLYPFTPEERHAVKVREGVGAVLLCDPPPHYPGN